MSAPEDHLQGTLPRAELPGGSARWFEALEAVDQLLSTPEAQRADRQAALQRAWSALHTDSQGAWDPQLSSATRGLQEALRSFLDHPGWRWRAPRPGARMGIPPEAPFEADYSFDAQTPRGSVIALLRPQPVDEATDLAPGRVVLSLGPVPAVIELLERESGRPELAPVLAPLARRLRQDARRGADTAELASALHSALNGPLASLVGSSLSWESLAEALARDGLSLVPSGLDLPVSTLLAEDVEIERIAESEGRRVRRFGLRGPGVPAALQRARVACACPPSGPGLEGLDAVLRIWSQRSLPLAGAQQAELDALRATRDRLWQARLEGERARPESDRSLLERVLRWIDDQLLAEGVEDAWWEELVAATTAPLHALGLRTWPTEVLQPPEEHPPGAIASPVASSRDGGALVQVRTRGFAPLEGAWSPAPEVALAASGSRDAELLMQLIELVLAHRPGDASALDQRTSAYRSAVARSDQLVHLFAATADLPFAEAEEASVALRSTIEQYVLEQGAHLSLEGARGRLVLIPAPDQEEVPAGVPRDIVRRRFHRDRPLGAIVTVQQRGLFFVAGDAPPTLLSAPPQLVESLGPPPPALGFALRLARQARQMGRPGTRVALRVREDVQQLRAAASRDPEVLGETPQRYGLKELFELYRELRNDAFQLQPTETEDLSRRCERFFRKQGFRVYPDEWDLEQLRLSRTSPLFEIDSLEDAEVPTGHIANVLEYGLIGDREADPARHAQDLEAGFVVGPARVAVHLPTQSRLGVALAHTMLRTWESVRALETDKPAWAEIRALARELLDAGEALDGDPLLHHRALGRILGFLLDRIGSLHPDPEAARAQLQEVLERFQLSLFPKDWERVSPERALPDPAWAVRYQPHDAGGRALPAGAVAAPLCRHGVEVRDGPVLLPGRLVVGGPVQQPPMRSHLSAFLEESSELDPALAPGLDPLAQSLSTRNRSLAEILERLGEFLVQNRAEDGAADALARYVHLLQLLDLGDVLELVLVPGAIPARELMRATPRGEDRVELPHGDGHYRLYRTEGGADEPGGVVQSTSVPAIRLPDGALVPGQLVLDMEEWEIEIEDLEEHVLGPMQEAGGPAAQVANELIQQFEQYWWTRDPSAAIARLDALGPDVLPPSARQALATLAGRD